MPETSQSSVGPRGSSPSGHLRGRVELQVFRCQRVGSLLGSSAIEPVRVQHLLACRNPKLMGSISFFPKGIKIWMIHPFIPKKCLMAWDDPAWFSSWLQGIRHHSFPKLLGTTWENEVKSDSTPSLNSKFTLCHGWYKYMSGSMSGFTKWISYIFFQTLVLSFDEQNSVLYQQPWNPGTLKPWSPGIVNVEMVDPVSP